jgi:hypothetical protein
MKKLITILGVVFINTLLFGQSPESFKYQAVIRDASGNIKAGANVSILISILKNSSMGQLVFAETQNTTTNAFGLVNLEIGSVNKTGIDTLDWSAGPYYIKVSVDGIDMGTSQLLSVPYALYAKNSLWKTSGSNIYYNGGKVGIATATPGSTMEVRGLFRTSSSTTRYLNFDAGNIDYNAYINFAGAFKTSRIIFQSNGVNKMVIHNNGRVGIGIDVPTQLLDVNGNANVVGNLTVGGTISGKVSIDSLHVSKIIGLLGQNNTMLFPDILNNYFNFSIDGVALTDKVVMVSSLGFETERISIPFGVDRYGKPKYLEQAGLSMEFPIIFETANTTDISILKNWFDATKTARSGSVIIKNLADVETGRWNYFEYIPDKYELGVDGRTRFTIKHKLIPNNLCHIEKAGDDFGDFQSFNPLTDKVVEIEGVSHIGFSPAVSVDTIQRTVTLTFDFNEGAGIYDWCSQTVKGLSSPKSFSIIETTDGVTEISRKNYFESIPIKWEIIYGFGLNNKLKGRVIIAYGYWENA